MKRLEIFVPDDLKEFMDDAVGSGEFEGPSELVVSALYAQPDRIALERAREEHLRHDIEAGLEQIRRGKVVEIDCGAFLSGKHAARDRL
ncbi:MAG: hypothetical protein V4726_22240 [Verrucomicrobiota bacterium]